MTTETDRLYTARTGESLATIMLRNGAVLPTPAPRTAEQAVTTAEQAEDVAVIDITEVPADAPCSHPSCAHADPASPCRCTYCIGAGHGWVTALAQDAARARFDAAHADPFALIPAASADAVAAVARTLRPFNPNTVIIDGEEW